MNDCHIRICISPTSVHLGVGSKEKYLNNSEVIIRDFYVDDLLTGVNTLQEVRKLQHELFELLLSAGLVQRKWASNNSKVFAKDNESSTEKLILANKDPNT